jgi:hypothetical protein
MRSDQGAPRGQDDYRPLLVRARWRGESVSETLVQGMQLGASADRKMRFSKEDSR